MHVPLAKIGFWLTTLTTLTSQILKLIHWINAYLASRVRVCSCIRS